MDLFKFPVIQIDKRLAFRRKAFGNPVSRADGFKSRPHPIGDARMLHITGHRNHDAIGLIQAMEEFFYQIRIKADNIFRASEDRTAQWAVTPEIFAGQQVDIFIRAVLHHSDFLQNDRALLFNFRGIKDGI